ncbi:MAG TPA: N-acetylmuramoyl-L-alanine amidase [Streptosporangiaceae bacterium]|nr:N-acetylmuramoyl-L-alanine amidase [Streptosporangiaceae bacterium]
MHRIRWALPAAAATLTACSVAPVTNMPNAAPPARPASTPARSARPGTSPAATAPASTQAPAVAAEATVPPRLPPARRGGPGRFPPTTPGVLDGKTVLVDPGHNGGNFTAPAIINRPIWNGREEETCDTTGTETATGYTEAQFNWNVARYLTADLRARGATVVLTRTSNTGIGPCVTERAALGNRAQASAAISIHADGGPPGGRGFAILEPVPDGINNAVIGPSARLGTDLRNAFAAGTGEPVSGYDGVDGIQPRDDLAGVNLTTVPKVFIECANMRNPTDAGRLVSPTWQARAARAIAAGLIAFLTGKR